MGLQCAFGESAAACACSVLFEKSDKHIFIWSWVNLICLVIYMGCMITKVHLLIVLPMVIAHGIILLTWALQSRKRLAGQRNQLNVS